MSDEAIVAALAEARRNACKLTDYPGETPASGDAAFALQQQVSRRLGWQQVGWKIGCTSTTALAALQADQPFPGAVFSERLYENGAHVPTSAQSLRLVEPEIAFTMAANLPARDTPYSCDEVMAAAGSVHGALEFVDRRAPGGFLDGVTWHIADGGLNDALVLGPAHDLLQPRDYASLPVRVDVNGDSVTSGISANAWGGADLALTWLANYLRGKSLGLKAGDVVTTGVITGLFSVEHGDRIYADFGGLGTVSAIA